MAETKTEKITRELLSKNEIINDKDGVIIYEKSEFNENPIITKALKQASKSPTGSGIGYPEFIIVSTKYKDLLIVIECKAKVTDHESKNYDKPEKYAVDGAIHYASHLSKSYDVIAIGISGEEKKNIRISSHLYLKNGVQKNFKFFIRNQYGDRKIF